MRRLLQLPSLAIIMLLSANLSLGQTIDLFNGKNLDGWINHGKEKWYVYQGELVCESGPSAEYGYLSTEKF